MKEIYRGERNAIDWIKKNCPGHGGGSNLVLVKSKVENIHWRDFHRVQKCIDLGAEAITGSLSRDIVLFHVSKKKSEKGRRRSEC